MKKSIALVTAVTAAALYGAVVWAAEKNQKVEASMLPVSAYRMPLEQVIVEGKRPYWQRETPPRWDKAKVEAPKPGEATAGRLQWAPLYTREEREDYAEPRDQMSPKARARIFEIRF